MAAPINLYTIDSPQLRAMLDDTRILTLVPCLLGVKQQRSNNLGSCGSCAAKKKKAEDTAMASAKACIVGLKKAQRDELKKILNARQLRLTVRRNGKIERLTL